MLSIRLWLLAIASAAAGLLLAPPGSLHSDATHAGDGTGLIALGTGIALWSAALWLTGLCGLEAVAVVPGRTGSLARALSARLTPRLLSSAVRVGVGATTGFGMYVAGPGALAAGPHQAVAVTSSCDLASDTVDLDRAPRSCPLAIEPSDIGDVGSPPSAATAVRVVRPGDSLWVIAADQLAATTGKSPAPQAIAAEWPLWWEANRDLIGPDPGLLHPGTALHVPGTAQHPED